LCDELNLVTLEMRGGNGALSSPQLGGRTGEAELRKLVAY
jgi:hypothetical protein